MAALKKRPGKKKAPRRVRPVIDPRVKGYRCAELVERVMMEQVSENEGNYTEDVKLALFLLTLARTVRTGAEALEARGRMIMKQGLDL